MLRMMRAIRRGGDDHRVGARWLRLSERLAGDQPPQGWDDPLQAGELVVGGTGRAVFTARDATITFVRAEEGTDVPDCS